MNPLSDFQITGTALGTHQHAPSAAYSARLVERAGALRSTLKSLIPPGAAFVWEVGCGHGHFLTAYAAAFPDRTCVGIDIVRERIDRAQRKAARARLPKLYFLNADATEFLAALPPGSEFSSIYLLFPDPWPKRRHHKNRLMTPGFLKAVAERAGENARLYFRTDFAPYFAEASATLRSQGIWEPLEEAWPFESETVFQSRAATYFSLIGRRK
jgi:tRNA (guanine-N7-)-methyltransferase